MVVGVKADCFHEGPRSMDGMPSVGIFLRDPSPYLRRIRDLKFLNSGKMNFLVGKLNNLFKTLLMV